MTNIGFWVGLAVLAPLVLLVMSMMIAVVNAGPQAYTDAKRLQGGLRAIMRGNVDPEFKIDNDPRIVEGMVRDQVTRKYEKNNRLSDDYLKTLFGS